MPLTSMPHFSRRLKNDHQRSPSDEIYLEKGPAGKEAVVTAHETDDDQETRPAHRVHCGAAVLDVFLALLPLYFVVFAVLGYLRNESLASSFRNQALFRMAALNPTLFPIVFGLIVAKFIKALATWRLERGATVGLIQLLLGSRSLVSSMMTPWKLRSISFFVPLLVLLWIMNPVGGQTSLRVVSKKSHYTLVDAPFYYLDRSTSSYTPIFLMSPQYNIAANQAFNTALFSPAASKKNGTQDVFGNLQIPMLEHLSLETTPDPEGWYSTIGFNVTGMAAAIADAVDINQGPAQPLYVSLLGLPFKRGEVAAMNETNPSKLDTKLERIKHDLFGDDVVNVQSLFNFETSYFYTNCSVRQIPIDGPKVTYDNYETVRKTTWPDSTAVVSNKQGLTIAYDKSHTFNSTIPRHVRFESWLADGDTFKPAVSEAWCELTTTYIEAQAYCSSEANCTISRMRSSQKPHPSSAISALDGITIPGETTAPNYGQQDYSDYQNQVAQQFFKSFVTSSGTGAHGPTTLTPLESYFIDPVTPYRTAMNDQQSPVSTIGSELFSWRFTQLLNTYWLASVDPYTLTGGIDLAAVAADESLSQANNVTGQVSIETIVLECSIPYMVVLICISAILFVIGLATAYLDATRKGPDVLDDFVNSLRHSPYVHVNQGSTMEDGQEKARRLRSTTIRMGDVRPDDPVGYVAIGTPNEDQPVAKLDHTRHYV